MNSSERLLRSYVSPFLASRLLADGGPPRQPGSQPGEAAVLFADIAGFTPLAERLGMLPAGTEELTHLLDDYFGTLLALVTQHGGEVVTFAGDALMAAWDVAGDPDGATYWAARCALAMQRIQQAGASHRPRLSLRVGIGVGKVRAMRVGGLGGHWQLLLCGAAVSQVGPAAQYASRGEVVLSPTAGKFAGHPRVGSLLRDGHFRLDDLQRRSAVEPSGSSVAAVTLDAVRGCVPDLVQAHVAAGEDDWTSEMRRITTVFVSLARARTVPSDSLESVQILMSEVQPILLECEGTLHKVIVDDKGTVLVAAFGPPPMAHLDDPIRAVRSALAVQAALNHRGRRSAVGIATGRAFCGTVGNESHREYVVLGDVVNLAARIMQAAPHTILCDERTYQAARSRSLFRSLPPLALKGVSDPVPVYQPLAGAVQKRPARPGVAVFVGRVTERAVLAEHLNRLVHGTSGIVSISGEPGIGKSRLLGEVVAQAASLGVRTLAGGGDSIDKGSPYHAWRPIFTELFAMTSLSEDQCRRAIEARMRRIPELEARAPLLNRVLPIDLPDSAMTEQLSGQARAAKTIEFLVDLIHRGADLAKPNSEPLLLLIDDAHWVDSASWALVRQACNRVDPILLIVAGRPDDGPLSDDYRRLSEEEGVEHLTLQPLDTEDAADLLSQFFPGKTISGPVAERVQNRAQGIPFFVEELACALEAGRPTDADRRASASDLPAALDYPASIEGVVSERLDRLAASSHLTLKVASVIGQTFLQETLQAVYPLNIETSMVLGCLDDLEQHAFIVRASTGPERAYRFRHALTREVTYDRLLQSQRRPLHRAVAEWYERDRLCVLPTAYRVLAHHWGRAGEPDNAAHYLGLSGEQSLREGAYREAADALERALRVGAGLRPPAAPLKRARWHRQLGDAYMSLGRLPDSRDQIRTALSLLGHSPPERRPQVVADLTWQLIKHAWRRLHEPALEAAASGEALEAARAYERLAFLDYYSNNRLTTLNSVLHSVNLAEAAPTSPELARGYATMGAGAGMLGLHSLARRYAQSARQTGRRVGDLPALAFVLLACAAYEVSLGAWIQARVSLSEGLEITERLGDHRRWGELAALWSQVLYHQGQFDALREWTLRMRSVAESSGDPQRQAHALLAEVCLLLPCGEPEKAVERIARAAELLKGRGAHADEILASGLLAKAEFRRGWRDMAEATAGHALDLIAHSGPVAVHAMEGYAGAAEVFLDLYEHGDLGVARAVHQSCLALRRFARAFPMARPRALLCGGLAHHLDGRSNSARLAWNASLAAATKLAMPYERARAHLEIGRHLPLGTRCRARHLDEARRVFIQLGAVHELKRAQNVS